MDFAANTLDHPSISGMEVFESLLSLGQIKLAVAASGVKSYEDGRMMHNQLTSSEVCEADFGVGGLIVSEGLTKAELQMGKALLRRCCFREPSLLKSRPQKHLLAISMFSRGDTVIGLVVKL